MADPCVTVPSATPTTGISPTTGLLGLIQRTISKGMRESTKRLIALVAAGTLCLCTIILTLMVAYQAVMRGAVDGQLVAALLGMGGMTAALAGVAYRKPDSTGSAQ